MVFLPLWLVAWFVGEVFAVRSFLRNEGPVDWLVVFWLVGWTLGGATALYAWLTQVWGKEVVTVSDRLLTIRREVSGLEPTRKYDLARIRNLRVDVGEAEFSPRWGWGFADGMIVFDYGSRQAQFGAGLDEARANGFVAALRSRIEEVTGTT